MERPLEVPGNSVLNDHHNALGKVFEHLVDVNEKNRLVVSSGEARFDYRFTLKMILPEPGQRLEVRPEHAKWFELFDNGRLTLVTCWQNENNTHRLAIVAEPIE